MIGYDSTDAAAVPADGDVYFGYIDGTWRSFAPLVARFGAGRCRSITAAGDTSADIADVESGDLTPDAAARWARARTFAGRVPILYSDRSTKPALDAALNVAWLWWAADPTGVDHLVSGSVATQWLWTRGYDRSEVTPAMFGTAGPGFAPGDDDLLLIGAAL